MKLEGSDSVQSIIQRIKRGAPLRPDDANVMKVSEPSDVVKPMKHREIRGNAQRILITGCGRSGKFFIDNERGRSKRRRRRRT